MPAMRQFELQLPILNIMYMIGWIDTGRVHVSRE